MSDQAGMQAYVRSQLPGAAPTSVAPQMTVQQLVQASHDAVVRMQQSPSGSPEHSAALDDLTRFNNQITAALNQRSSAVASDADAIQQGIQQRQAQPRQPLGAPAPDSVP